jgi:uncharacterized repeat protein (TIGR03803 family)
MRERKIARSPSAPLVIAAVLIVTIFSVPGASAAVKFKTLYLFSSRVGGETYGGVIFDEAGNLYGSRPVGGAYNFGMVFQLRPNGNGSWTERVLHSFNRDGQDGFVPQADLMFDQVGNLYGTTTRGGADDSGTVFQLSPNGSGSWTENILYSFKSDGEDGGGPEGDLIFDRTGNLYGTTVGGGAYNYGTVFQLSPNGNGSWTESVLHSFINDGKDGGVPFAGVIFDSAGNLYGTTLGGGAYDYGTVFRLSPNGDGSWTESVLHSFNADGKDGYGSFAGIIFDPAGNLYGTTLNGGAYNAGTVFQLAPNGDGSWKESILHSFNVDGKDGYQSWANLTFDHAGNLYGTTKYGGTYDRGTVFKLKPTLKGGWREAVEHSFLSLTGAYPLSGLTLDVHGSLYGTTRGARIDGTVFELTP